MVRLQFRALYDPMGNQMISAIRNSSTTGKNYVLFGVDATSEFRAVCFCCDCCRVCGAFQERRALRDLDRSVSHVVSLCCRARQDDCCRRAFLLHLLQLPSGGLAQRCAGALFVVRCTCLFRYFNRVRSSCIGSTAFLCLPAQDHHAASEQLLQGFLASAAKFLLPSGELRVTLCAG